MLKGFNKRGLNDIVTMVIIILVTIVAIVIISAVVLNSIRVAGSKIETQSANVKFSIPQQSVFIDSIVKKVKFVVKREAGEGSLIGYNAVIEDSTGKSILKRINNPIKEFSSEDNEVSYAELKDAKRITISPIFKDSRGKEYFGEASGEYFITDTEKIIYGIGSSDSNPGSSCKNIFQSNNNINTNKYII